MKVTAIFLAAGLIVSAYGPASAQTTELNTEATRMNNLAASQGETKVVDKISGDFSSFLGTDSKAVVTGLRNGTPITLTSTTTTAGATAASPAVTTTNTTLINPPTGKMGFGNVFISLALAKQQLNTLGITQPTPAQLQAALTGGPITLNTGTTTTGTAMTSTSNLDGILTMRSQHMGWGQIAQKLNFKLGPVISGMKHTNQTLTTTTSAQSTATAAGNAESSKSSGTGIVSGGGQSQSNSGHGVSSGKGSSDGIVTASGKSNGNGSSYSQGRSGVVTGSGHSAGGNGALSNGGNTSSHGKGNGK